MPRPRQEDSGEGEDATPEQPQMRRLGLIITGLGMLLLSAAGIAYLHQQLSFAASLAMGIGTISALLCFISGFILYVDEPFDQTQYTYVAGAIFVGVVICLLIQWAVMGLPNLFPAEMLLFRMSGFSGALVGIGVAPFEEFLCIFIQILGMRSGERGAVIGIGSSAAVFAAFHLRSYLISPAILVMFLVGIVKGVAFYYVPYCEVPISIHLILNVIAVLPIGVFPL